MPTLFVIRGTDQGSRFELTEPTVRLGRDASNTIQLHDTEVSRHHAEIRRVDDDYAISDLNSSNGTFVNGQRIRQQHLASGDQIQVGSTLMLYTGPAEETRRRPGRHRSASAPPGGLERPVADRPLGDPGGGEPDLRSRRRASAELLARPGAQQPAGDVPHGAGGQPHAGHRPVAAADHGADLRVGRGRPRLHHADGPGEQDACSPRSAAPARASAPTSRSRSARRSSTT